MIIYQISLGERQIKLSLDSSDPNRSGQLDYTGSIALIAEIQFLISDSSGAFGHLMSNNFSTPIDLDAVLRSPAFSKFDIKILEGEELVKIYDPDIPPEALT